MPCHFTGERASDHLAKVDVRRQKVLLSREGLEEGVSGGEGV